MKKYIGIFLILFLLASGLLPSFTRAQTEEPLSLSDAVLADLALHNYLDYVSIDFKDKKSPNTISINQDKQWLPASTVKLFVAMYATDQITKKNISLDQWVTIDEKNVVPTELETSDYPVLTAGLTTTVDTLLKMMITQSDNTAYNTLLDLLDRQEVTLYIQGLGLKHTIIGSKLNLDDNQNQYEYTTPGFNINTTTASDYETAYDMIDSNKIPGSALLFNILKQQKIQNMIPALLPAKQLTIAHKTGDLDPLYHDGGIIVGDNKHYILTIFTNLGNPNILAHISQLIFTKNYKLVGAQIPDKNSIRQAPQALDPLVMNPNAYQSVLAAATSPINIPIPQITAADLGITPKDLSLVIPDNKLPKSLISPTSPFYALIPAWYGLQQIVAVGEKNRQHVALVYAQQLLADAKTLQKQGQTQQVSAYMNHVQTILNSVATDRTKPDAETQLEIQAASQTQFATLKDQVGKTTDDDARLALLKQVADHAKQTLTTIAPNVPLGKTLAATNQQPLIGHIVDDTPGHVVVETASGQRVNVTITNETKVLSQTPVIAAPATPTVLPIGEETVTPSVIPSPTTGPTQKLQKGATVALLGTIQGNTFTSSVAITNLHRELAAPQPVTVVKVNTQNNTMVVDENGTPIQVDLSSQTSIKAKDTNVPLKAIQPGSVVVVHGTEVQQVQSDTKIPTPSVSPTVVPAASQKTAPTASVSPNQPGTTTTPAITGGEKTNPSVTSAQPTTTTGKTTPAPTGKSGTAPTVTQTTGKSIQVTAPKQSAPSTTQPVAPRVINATSVQVVQQKPTGSQSQPSRPSSKPAESPKQSAPQQSAPVQQQQPQKPVDNTDKKSGK